MRFQQCVSQAAGYGVMYLIITFGFITGWPRIHSVIISKRRGRIPSDLTLRLKRPFKLKDIHQALPKSDTYLHLKSGRFVRHA